MSMTVDVTNDITNATNRLKIMLNRGDLVEANIEREMKGLEIELFCTLDDEESCDRAITEYKKLYGCNKYDIYLTDDSMREDN